jgi:hypothetical protein
MTRIERVTIMLGHHVPPAAAAELGRKLAATLAEQPLPRAERIRIDVPRGADIPAAVAGDLRERG